MFLMSWALRALMIVMATIGYGLGLPLAWVPALAAGFAIVTAAISTFFLDNPGSPLRQSLFQMARVLADVGTVLLLCCIPLAVYWFLR